MMIMQLLTRTGRSVIISNTSTEIEKEFNAAENESVTGRRILFSEAISTYKKIEGMIAQREANQNAEEERKKVTHSMHDFDKKI